MTKLKCWRKTIHNKNQITYRKIKFNRFISGMDVDISTLPEHEVYIVNLPNGKRKVFERKSAALRFARSYMKRHDRC